MSERILCLCSRLPYPLTGGAKVRMFYTAQELSRQYNVELLVVDEEPIEQSAVDELEAQFEAVHTFSYPTYRCYLNALRGVLSRRPLQTHYYQFDAVSRWLDDNHDRFDLLYCNHVRTAEYVCDYDCPTIIDLVDAISRNYKAAREHASGLWRFVYPIEWRRLQRHERRVTETFDHSFIISETDRQFITDGISRPSLSVLPNGVKPELLERESTGHRADPNDPRIVFLGKMDYFPNVDAAIHFATTVFPKLKNGVPSAQFFIVGSSPNKRVRELDERHGVTVTGFVDDPWEYLNSADIVVAPMRSGAGLQNKVLEAMALERPVVVSPLAKEGIEAIDGTHLVVADAVDAFANAIQRLLSNEDRRREIGTAARELIEQKYTWERIGGILRDEVSSVLNDSSFTSVSSRNGEDT